jgi:hypothetical protein
MDTIVAPFVKPGETAVTFGIGGRVRPTPKKISNCLIESAWLPPSFSRGSRASMQRGIDRAPHPRLVSPCPPPRLAVQISVLDRRASFGRSRTFKLIEPDVARLIDEAERLESRQ